MDDPFQNQLLNVMTSLEGKQNILWIYGCGKTPAKALDGYLHMIEAVLVLVSWL